ncbi:MAG: glycosyltransferase family 4 protein [Symploca sp. SIO2E6]|nr:glycosyltransferase family 4 protein [Symploca sp. SIO2E6]
MKITFVLPTVSYKGGIRSTALLAEALRKRGNEVLVVSQPKPLPTPRQQLRSLLKGQGWIATVKSPPSHLDNVDVPHQVIDCYRPFKDSDVPDADVIVATWWENAESLVHLSESKGAKVYFVRHHEVHDYLPKERAAATYLLPLHKITIAKWLVELMRTRYGDSHVSLVPDSLDHQLFYAPPRGKQPTPAVGMMYSTTNWKGCDISLDAFSLAAKKIPNLRLVAFGGNEPSPNLPLPPNTEYVLSPPQNQLKDFYAKCDAWLFGSRLEGFGLPILEAMACRTPVIGTPAGAAPELLTEGAGILVKPEDPEDMARAIEKVCQFSDSEWRAMSDLAQARAISYTWDDAAELCEAAFGTAIERWKRGDFSAPSL